jgi:hypothetical protein
MSRLPLQSTRFERFQRQVLDLLLGGWGSSWRARSLVILSLLLGFFAGQNITAWWLVKIGQRPEVVLVMVVLLELVVRLRSRLVVTRPPLAWLVIDNLRIGMVYAVVLEAFKLGS